MGDHYFVMSVFQAKPQYLQVTLNVCFFSKNANVQKENINKSSCKTLRIKK